MSQLFQVNIGAFWYDLIYLVGYDNYAGVCQLAPDQHTSVASMWDTGADDASIHYSDLVVIDPWRYY